MTAQPARVVTPSDVLDLLEGDPVDVAPHLLGAVVAARDDDGAVAVRLTEVEAYRGETDPGSHAFRGRTPRNSAMFGAAGAIYVYFTYGMHHCVNIVCGPQGLSRAVLLRAGEVIRGADLARRRRPAAKTDRDLARGPARLCRALGLGRADDGARLGGPDDRVSLTLPALESGPGTAVTRSGPRTGVAGTGGDGEAYPWRFWIDGEPTVSPYRAARPRRRRHDP
ncbi:DNA-3-methyladenine glycosylase [Actinomyces gerencseriae]|jgi:DNA-3-methyladenine glycosylase|uniref:DNA-3-methyladenine glycosylase n=1 Tax=Actinomyces gerencseriae TaxID=52769 RepID=UPI0004063AEA|nr:DNA-3-methyladenine glycosylase [Actinomyces gerencseriae]